VTALADDAEIGELLADPNTPAQPHQSTLRSLLRLRRWTRPYRKTIIAMFVFAAGGMLAQSVVPLVIGAVIDGPIQHNSTSSCGHSSASRSPSVWPRRCSSTCAGYR